MVIVMLIVALGIFGGRGMWSGGGHHSSGPATSQQEKTALDLLDEVYARGEISREDYLSNARTCLSVSSMPEIELKCVLMIPRAAAF